MIQQLERTLCLEKYPEFPQSFYDPKENDIIERFPKVLEKYDLILPEDINHFQSDYELASAICKLVCGDSSSLIFLGDNENTWLTEANMQQTEYPEITNAVAYLRQAGIDEHFNGGIVVPQLMAVRFLEHLIALVSYDASLPYIYFMPPERTYLCSITQYEELFFYALNEQGIVTFRERYPKTNLIINDSGSVMSSE